MLVNKDIPKTNQTPEGLLIFIKKYFKEFDKIPDLEIIKTETKLSESQIIKYFDLLSKQGKINKRDGKYFIKRNIVNPFLLFSEKNINLSKIKYHFRKFDKFLIFKMIVLLLGILSAYMAVHYDIFMFTVSMGNVLGVIGSVVLVGGFNVSAIFVVYYYKDIKVFTKIKKDKKIKVIKRKWGMVLLFIFLALIIFCIDMISMMSGQFIRYQDKLFSQSEKSLGNITYVKSTIKEEEFSKEISFRIKDRDKLQQDNFKLNIDVTSDRIKFYSNKKELQKLNDEIKHYQIELEKARKEQKDLTDKDSTIIHKKIDFFQYLSNGVFKERMSAEQIQFTIYLLPAFLFNIISCVSFAFVLHARRRKKLINKKIGRQ